MKERTAEEEAEWALMNPLHEDTVQRCEDARVICQALQKMITLSEWEHEQLGECLKIFAYFTFKHKEMGEKTHA